MSLSRSVPALSLVVLCPLALAEEPIDPEPVDLIGDVPTPLMGLPQGRNPISFESDQVLRVGSPARDLFAMGQRVTLDASVDDNAFAMGQDVYVQGPVMGDLFVMGQTVHVESAIAGDLYGFAQRIVLTDRASVGGDIHAGGAIVEIDGPVMGNLSVGAGELALSAKVAGDADLEVGQLHLREGARIGGNLDYEAPAPIDGLDGIVSGAVTFTQKVEPVDDDTPKEAPSFLSRAMTATAWMIWSYGSKLLVGFTFLLLGGATAGRVARALVDQPARALGLGFVTLCVLPVASTVAVATVLPLPLGLLGLLAFGVALYAGQIIAAQALGDLILRRLQPGALGSPYISMAVGLVALIADDEPRARARLRRLLEEHADVSIIGEAATGDEAMQMTLTLRPDVVFLDVRMPGPSGTEVAHRLVDYLPEQVRPAVVFTTAHAEHAVEAFAAEGVDYLLKPIERERLAMALRRVRKISWSTPSPQPSLPSPAPSPPVVLEGHHGTASSPVAVGAIRCIEVEEGITFAYTDDGSRMRLATGLLELEQSLSDQFLRVSRSAIVALDQIAAIHPQPSGTCEVELQGGRRVAVSRRRVRALRERMGL